MTLRFSFDTTLQLLAFVLLLTGSQLVYAQDIRALPDTLNEVSPGNRVYIELPAAEPQKWNILQAPSAWFMLRSDQLIRSGEVKDAAKIQRIVFQAMKPGRTAITLTAPGEDTLSYKVLIHPWPEPLKQISDLQKGAIRLSSENPQRISVGSSFWISQPENRNTPFFWKAEIEEPHMLSLDRQQYFPNSDDPTAAGTHAWRIRTLNPGKTHIMLQFVGPGKRGSRPAFETIRYELEILP